jgi:hypothetical protein
VQLKCIAACCDCPPLRCPAQVFTLTVGLVSCAAANAAVVARIHHVTRVADDYRTSSARNVDCLIDILADINTRVIPCNMNAFNSPLQNCVAVGLTGGCGYLYKAIILRRVHIAEASGSGRPDSSSTSQLALDLSIAFISILCPLVLLLLPAQSTTMCNHMISIINELRRYSRTTTANAELDGMSPRQNHKLVQDSEIARLECMIAYIRDANGGHGMVRSVSLKGDLWAFMKDDLCIAQGYRIYGVRLEAGLIKNIIRGE